MSSKWHLNLACKPSYDLGQNKIFGLKAIKLVIAKVQINKSHRMIGQLIQLPK